MDILELYNTIISGSFMYSVIAACVTLLVASFFLHLAAKFLGVRRGYEIALGVTFFTAVFMFIIRWVLNFVDVTLSTGVSAIVGLILWMYLVKSNYRVAWGLSFIMFVVMICVQIIFYSLVSLLFLLF